ncbi:MAG: matrixin family metalloprotease [Phycisphaerae bacterium]
MLGLLALGAGCNGGAWIPGTFGSLGQADRDEDGLSDRQEAAFGTDPDSPDTDGDSLPDALELNGQTSPIDADSDNDGLTDQFDQHTPIEETSSPQAGASESDGPVAHSTGNDVEPNDHWHAAVALPLTEQIGIRLRGTINHRDDVDIYELGPSQTGSRLTYNPGLIGPNVKLGLFDEDGLAYFVASGQRALSYDLDFSSDATYLALARGPADRTGPYEISITKAAPTLAARVTQTVVLDFDGGTSQRPILGINRLTPFDAAAIDPQWENDTDDMKRRIVEIVRDRFAAFDIEVLVSTEAPRDSNASRIIIGSGPAPAYGAAQGIDVDNRNCCDDGLVFIDAFERRAFWPRNNQDAVTVAIAQVIAHEIGHLLGLHHVNDPAAIMDEASPSIFLTYPQTFKTAPLADGVFPIGQQDAERHLHHILGPAN